MQAHQGICQKALWFFLFTFKTSTAQKECGAETPLAKLEQTKSAVAIPLFPD